MDGWMDGWKDGWMDRYLMDSKDSPLDFETVLSWIFEHVFIF